MARTLRNKYTSIWISVMECNPGHEMISMSGIGFIHHEWEWCEENLARLFASINIAPENFNHIAGKLLRYVQFRRKNQTRAYIYPEPNYTLSKNPQRKIGYFATQLGADLLFWVPKVH